MKPEDDGAQQTHDDAGHDENGRGRRDAEIGVVDQQPQQDDDGDAVQLHPQRIEVVLPEHAHQQARVVVVHAAHGPQAQRFGQVGLHTPGRAVQPHVFDGGRAFARAHARMLRRLCFVGDLEETENVLVGELKVERYQSDEGHHADEEAQAVAQDFLPGMRLVRQFVPGVIAEVETSKGQGNQGIVDAKLRERARQRSEEGKAVGAQQVGGQIPRHDQRAKSHPHDEKTPEAHPAHVLGRPEKEVDAEAAPEVAGDEQCQKHPDGQQQHVVAQVDHRELHGEGVPQVVQKVSHWPEGLARLASLVE